MVGEGRGLGGVRTLTRIDHSSLNLVVQKFRFKLGGYYWAVVGGLVEDEFSLTSEELTYGKIPWLPANLPQTIHNFFPHNPISKKHISNHRAQQQRHVPRSP